MEELTEEESVLLKEVKEVLMLVRWKGKKVESAAAVACCNVLRLYRC